jgi:hypothetical protein
MANDTEMTIDERWKYLRRLRPRYLAADRRGRGALLAEMERATGLHRKSLIRLLGRAELVRRARPRQRGRAYGAAVDDAIRVVWESLDYVCAERLTPALAGTARLLAGHGELALTAALAAQLGAISVATVQRRLSRFAIDTPRLPRKGPAEANAVARAIPMRRIPWDEATPGHFETDLVHHSGASTAGEYVHTLQMVDVATGWSERVAVLGRSQRHMEVGFRRIEARLPFAILEVHPDNGSEFLNHHLVRYWTAQTRGIVLSRSRPYEKNDNRIVEQKNSTLVRAYFGDHRLDSAAACAAMNALYDRMWLYYNFFQPVRHLVEKTAGGGRIRRRWDEARTPFERLVATGLLAPDEQRRLEALRDATNPRALRREIYARIDALLSGRPFRSAESAA